MNTEDTDTGYDYKAYGTKESYLEKSLAQVTFSRKFLQVPHHHMAL